MGFYRDQLLPRIQDKLMDRKPLREVRTRVCEGLRGDAGEPSRICMRIAEPRIARCNTAVEHGGLTGEHLDLPSHTFDAALSTWTLCTIPNLDAALAELRRVLNSAAAVT
jgi:hypothetical protein